MTGRPTDYDPAYCEQVIDFMADGYSLTAFAGSIRVSRQTVYNWADTYPEFLDALNIARAAAAMWWEQKGRSLAETGEGSAAMVIFGLKNRVADEWRDKQAVEHSGPDGGPIQTEDTGARDALAAFVSRIAAAGHAGAGDSEPDGDAS